MSIETYYFCDRVPTTRGATAQGAFDYAARQGPYHAHPDPLVHLSSGAMPDWVQDLVGGGDYWAAADEFARVGARRVFVIVVALPLVLSPDQRIQCAEEFADAVSRLGDDPYGRLPYTLAIHSGYGRNPHLHLLLSQCLNQGHPLKREQWFRRFRADQPELGGAPKVVIISQRRWLLALRETWENVGNRVLARCGTGHFLDRRSYDAKGLDRIPGLRLAPWLSPQYPQPASGRRAQRNAEIAAENRRRDDEDAMLQLELKRLSRQALRTMDIELRRIWLRHRRNERDSGGAPALATTASLLRDAWQAGTGGGVGIFQSDTSADDVDLWQRLHELVHEPGYRYAAAHWLDNGWVAGVSGPYVVWLHPEAEPLVDGGGAIWTCGRGPNELAALANLWYSRNAPMAQCKGPSVWRHLVAWAFGCLETEVAVTSPVPRTSIARGLPKPSPYRMRP